MKFELSTESEQQVGFEAADRIRDLMNDLNRSDIPALCVERSDEADSVYSHLGRGLEALFRQLGLTPQEAMQARMHTCDSDARGAYEYMLKQRPCETCQGHGSLPVYDQSTDAEIGSRPCTDCPPF